MIFVPHIFFRTVDYGHILQVIWFCTFQRDGRLIWRILCYILMMHWTHDGSTSVCICINVMDFTCGHKIDCLYRTNQCALSYVQLHSSTTTTLAAVSLNQQMYVQLRRRKSYKAIRIHRIFAHPTLLRYLPATHTALSHIPRHPI